MQIMIEGETPEEQEHLKDKGFPVRILGVTQFALAGILIEQARYVPFVRRHQVLPHTLQLRLLVAEMLEMFRTDSFREEATDAANRTTD